jgi:lysophospholipase L1-like esterase
MSRSFWVGLLGLSLAALSVLLALYVNQRFAYADYVIRDTIYPNHLLLSKRLETDTVLNIALIGDSWIHNGEVGEFLQSSLSDLGRTAKLQSFGYCGATSRDLYQMITQPSPLSHFAKQNWEYVVVVIGVNDASGQYGPDFYAQHTLWIAERIISMGAFPIIVELPTFAIEESTALFPWIKRVRNQFFAWWQGCDVNNISCYRDALEQKINESVLKDNIRIVDFDSVCSQYDSDQDLYRDFFHLNRRGNQKLATAIVASITER